VRDVVYITMPPKSIKSVTITNEPVFVTKDGVSESYIPREILTHRDAYSASLHLLFKHVAGVHLLMVEIIAEKYNLDADEIIKTVQNDQRMKEIQINPTLESLTYFEKKDIEKIVPCSEVVVETPVAPVKPPRKRKVILKPAIPSN